MTWWRRSPTPSPARTRSSWLGAARVVVAVDTVLDAAVLRVDGLDAGWLTVAATSTVRRSSLFTDRRQPAAVDAAGDRPYQRHLRRRRARPPGARHRRRRARRRLRARRSSARTAACWRLVWATSRRTDDRAWALPIEALEPSIAAARSRSGEPAGRVRPLTQLLKRFQRSRMAGNLPENCRGARRGARASRQLDVRTEPWRRRRRRAAARTRRCGCVPSPARSPRAHRGRSGAGRRTSARRATSANRVVRRRPVPRRLADLVEDRQADAHAPARRTRRTRPRSRR